MQAPDRSASDSAAIAAFYDGFNRRLLRDYVHGNRRVDRAVASVCSVLDGTRRTVLDVGCGIGVSSAAYRAHAPHVSVHGVDISPRNIEVATRLFGGPGLEFGVSSMERPPDRRKYDVVALLDVYEHVPRNIWPRFNAVLAECLADNGLLVLTCPSPLHQQYLAEHKPDGLQIVDETIEPADLCRLADDVGASLVRYELASVWKTNDYVHAILSRHPEYRPLDEAPVERRSFARRVASSIAARFKRRAQNAQEQRRQHVRQAIGVEV